MQCYRYNAITDCAGCYLFFLASHSEKTFQNFPVFDHCVQLLDEQAPSPPRINTKMTRQACSTWCNCSEWHLGLLDILGKRMNKRQSAVATMYFLKKLMRKTCVHDVQVIKESVQMYPLLSIEKGFPYSVCSRNLQQFIGKVPGVPLPSWVAASSAVPYCQSCGIGDKSPKRWGGGGSCTCTLPTTVGTRVPSNP